MRVLLVHNYYQQPGGEDTVMGQEATLLRNAGDQVIEYHRSNDEINGFGSRQKLTFPKRVIWASDSARALRKLIQRERPEVAHFHNTFSMISPAAYYACQAMNVPVVQSLHNQRLMCPASTFYRDGGLCEDCLGKAIPWPGILHACYQNSRVRTAGVAAMLATHRGLKTWKNQVDAYIVFTEFYRRKFVEGGLPPEKIVVKPHFVYPDPGPRERGPGDYALFIGRLDPEKGVRTLLKAWQQIKDIPLKIRGDGRLLEEVQAFVGQRDLDLVEVVGRQSKEELTALIKGARFLVWPSEGHYENFGLVAVEAFACGVPVIASRAGVMTEIVNDKRTGLHFTPGDHQDLAAKVRWAWTHPAELERMGIECRAEFEAKYTAERNYPMLMGIYERVMNSKSM